MAHSTGRQTRRTSGGFLRAILMLSCIGMLFMCGGCRDVVRAVGDPAKEFPREQGDRPFVFIYVTPAYTRDYPVAGVLVAVWADGTVVRATTEAEVGKSYVRGRLDREQVQQVRRMIGESDVLKMHEGGSLIVDAKAENLTVRWGKVTRTWAHNPGDEKIERDATNPILTNVKKRLMGVELKDARAEPKDKWDEYPHGWYE